MSKFFEEPILSDSQKEEMCSCDQGSVSPEARYNDYRNRMPFHYIEDDINDGYYYWTYGATMEIEFELEGNIAFGEGLDLSPEQIIVDSELSLTSKNPVENKVITEALNNKLDKSTEVSDFDQAYIKTADGTESLKNISADTLSDSIVSRGPSGRFKILDAIEDDQPITLKQAKAAHAIQADLGDIDPTSVSFVKGKKTSNLQNDGNGTSPFATVKQLDTKLDILDAPDSVYVTDEQSRAYLRKYGFGGDPNIIVSRWNHGELIVRDFESAGNAYEWEATSKHYVDKTIKFSLDNLNIQNGIGENSLIQKSPDGKPTSALKLGTIAFGQNSVSNQKFDIAIGGGAVAGFAYKNDFNSFYYDYVNKKPLHGGQGLNAQGEVLDFTGNTYENSFGWNRSFGEGTIARGRSAVAFQNGQAIGLRATSFGFSGSYGDNAFAIGNETAASGSNTFTQGNSTTAGYDNQAAFGRYNENKEENIFEVGIGSGEPDEIIGLPETKTGFAVLRDGRAKVLTAPKEDDDVVRLLELNNLDTRYKNQLNTKLDKTGGTIDGTLSIKENLNVTGNLNVSGTATAVKTQSLLVVDNVIATNADKKELTTLLSGLALNKNANETYGVMYDPADNTVKFGQGTLSNTGVFTFNTGEGKPLAIRAQSGDLAENHLIKWDSITNSFIDSGKAATDFVEVQEFFNPSKGTEYESEVAYDAYTVDKDGNTGVIPISANRHSGNTLVLRFNDGRISASDATDPHNVTTKVQVEKMLSDKVGFKYYKLENKDTDSIKEDVITTSQLDASLDISHSDENTSTGLNISKDYVEMYYNKPATQEATAEGARVSIGDTVITINSSEVTAEGDEKKTTLIIDPDRAQINEKDIITSAGGTFEVRPTIQLNGKSSEVATLSDLENVGSLKFSEFTSEEALQTKEDLWKIIDPEASIKIIQNDDTSNTDIGLQKGAIGLEVVNDSEALKTNSVISMTDSTISIGVNNTTESKSNTISLDKDGIKVNDNPLITKIQDSSSNEFTPDEYGVVTIPNGSTGKAGLWKLVSSTGYHGLQNYEGGQLAINPAGKPHIDQREAEVMTGNMSPIIPSDINYAVKAALTDDKRMGTETSGTNTAFTDTEKDRACEIIGAARYAMKVTIL